MHQKELEEMLQACEASSLDYFKFVNEEEELVFRRTPTLSNEYGMLPSAPTLTQTPILQGTKLLPPIEERKTEAIPDIIKDVNIITIYSNFIGIVTLSDPFKTKNKNITVKKGEVLCVVEAMKIYNEILSTTSGYIEEILVHDGDMIECEQPLFQIRSDHYE